ncbi:hypothetical protein GGF32_007836 [Allomyces javanicus]|nr:hypothetical protein GGF32_007836 [Allomyces javanicus]
MDPPVSHIDTGSDDDRVRKDQLNDRDYYGLTPLGLCLSNPTLYLRAIVQVLLDAGADPTIGRQTGCDPVPLSVMLNAFTIMNLEADAGLLKVIIQRFPHRAIQAHAKSMWSVGLAALCAATVDGNLIPLKLLLELEMIKVDEVFYESGMQPLHVAADHNSADTVRFLLDRGAVVNARAQDGRTPLHFAAGKGSTIIMDLLISNGASLQDRDNMNWTALAWAVAQGKLAAIEYAIVHDAPGAARKFRGDCSESLVDIAIKNKLVDCAVALALDGIPAVSLPPNFLDETAEVFNRVAAHARNAGNTLLTQQAGNQVQPVGLVPVMAPQAAPGTPLDPSQFSWPAGALQSWPASAAVPSPPQDALPAPPQDALPPPLQFVMPPLSQVPPPSPPQIALPQPPQVALPSTTQIAPPSPPHVVPDSSTSDQVGVASSLAPDWSNDDPDGAVPSAVPDQLDANLRKRRATDDRTDGVSADEASTPSDADAAATADEPMTVSLGTEDGAFESLQPARKRARTTLPVPSVAESASGVEGTELDVQEQDAAPTAESDVASEGGAVAWASAVAFWPVRRSVTFLAALWGASRPE